MGVTPPYIPPTYGHHGSLRRSAIGLAEAGNSHFFAISGRTDLRKGVSEAKFDPEADFDVKKSLRPPKSAENREKPKKNREFFSKKNFFFDFFFFDSESFETRFGEVWRVKNCEKTANKTRKIRAKFAKNLVYV